MKWSDARAHDFPRKVSRRVGISKLSEFQGSTKRMDLLFESSSLLPGSIFVSAIKAGATPLTVI